MSRTVYRYDRIESTMHRAAELAVEHCASGTAVVAKEQTAGYGRYGRSWYSAPGEGLYVSIVLRLGLKPADLPVTTLALGIATAGAIERLAGVKCDLRWPNDVMIKDRKVSGILTQLQGDAVIAGIGVNLRHREFPQEIAALATSVYRETGRDVDSEELLDGLFESIDDHCDILVHGGAHAIIELFTHQSSYAQGRRVFVDTAGETIEGVTAGLDSAGFLIVTDTDGRKHTIVAGGVRPAR